MMNGHGIDPRLARDHRRGLPLARHKPVKKRPKLPGNSQQHEVKAW
jgi:hypothetical protein